MPVNIQLLDFCLRNWVAVLEGGALYTPGIISFARRNPHYIGGESHGRVQFYQAIISEILREVCILIVDFNN